MRNKQKIYTIGDRPSFYLKKHTPDQLVSLINKQSDLTLLIFHALELYYDKYGNTDCSTILPRNHEFLAKHSPTYDLTPAKVTKETKAVRKEQPSPSVIENTIQQSSHVENETNMKEYTPEVKHQEQNIVVPEVKKQGENITIPEDMKPIENEKKPAWAHLNVEDDPYA